jgi:hypothetical protein
MTGKYHYTKSPKPHITSSKLNLRSLHGRQRRRGSWLQPGRRLDGRACKWLEAADIVWKEGVRPALRADVPGTNPAPSSHTTQAHSPAA